MNKDILTFKATGHVDFKAASDATGPVRCSITAYTGGLIYPGGRGASVIDLSGLKCGDNCTLLADHNDTLDGILGSGTPDNDGSQVTVDGQLSRGLAAVDKIIALSAVGTKFQASVGVEMKSIERCAEGATVQANGQLFTAPKGGLTVVRAGVLRECSILAMGADSNTSVSIAASKSRTPKMLEHEVTATFHPDLAAERKRVNDIIRLTANYPAIQETAIDEGWDATTTEIEVLRAEQKNDLKTEQLRAMRSSRNIAPNSTHGTGPTMPEVLAASLCLSAGMVETFAGKQFDQRTMNEAAALKNRNLGFHDIMRMSAEAAGLHTNERRGPEDIYNAAIKATHMLRASGSSYASIPNILANVQNKFLLQGYGAVETTWPTFCAIQAVKDFKALLTVRLISNGTFPIIGNDNELTHDALTDQGFANKVDTYGKQIFITRQMLINDDVGALSAAPIGLGRDCAIAQEDLVYTVLLANAGSFFGTPHGNYSSGGGTALSLTSLGSAETLFRDQTGPNGKPIMVVPKVLLVPTTLAPTARNLVRSTSLVGNTSAATSPLGLLASGNPFDSWFDVQTSPWLNSQSLTGSSSTAWYLFGGPGDIPAIAMAFLNGAQQPIIQTSAADAADFDSLGVRIRAYSDFGAALQDYRGAVKMAGA